MEGSAFVGFVHVCGEFFSGDGASDVDVDVDDGEITEFLWD